MTKKDFFIMLVKVFGLYSAITSLFSILPGNIMLIIGTIDILSILWISLVITIVITFFILLVFNADRIVQRLKLDRGFQEERIELGNLRSIDVVKIGTFVIGGLLIIETTPGFLNNTYFSFKKEIIGLKFSDQDKFNWGVSAVKLLIGYLLLTNYQFVANLLKDKGQINRDSGKELQK